MASMANWMSGGVLLGLLMMFAGVRAAEPEGADQPGSQPHDVVRRATDELVSVIEEGKTYAEQDPERFYRAVYDVLNPVVDFESFAEGVMAVYNRRASPEQRERFEETFKWGLVRTYGKALLQFDQQRIDVLPPDRPARNPRVQTVRMQVHADTGKIYPVDYTMALGDDGQWRIRNIVINGINIGLTYRNQFASAMRSPENAGDLDKVIAGWGETIANVDPVAGEGQGGQAQPAGAEEPSE